MSWLLIVGLVASLIGIAGFLWKLARGGARAYRAFTEMAEKVKSVHDETSHNGGGSLKDNVVAGRQELSDFKEETHRNFLRVDRHLRSQDKHLAAQDKRIDRLYEGTDA